MLAVIRLLLHTSLNTLSLIIDTKDVDVAVINAKPSERNLSTYDSHYKICPTLVAQHEQRHTGLRRHVR